MQRVVRKAGFVSRLLVAAVLILGPGVAQAGHDDTTLVGLKVTVTDVTNNTVTIEVSGRGIDSSYLSSARLGSQFWYDKSTSTSLLDHWTNMVPPAIDWGDGSTIANTGVPITSRVSSTSTSGRDIAYFKGQFMHTYASPGSYTIRAFGSNVYAACCSGSSSSYSYTITSGNPYMVVSPGIVFNSGSSTNTTWYTGTVPIGLTNTAAATVSGTGGGGFSFVPSHGSSCGLLGIEPVLVFPLLAMKRRKRRTAS